MDILLVNPSYVENIYKSTKVVAVKPPLGLAYIAAALEDVSCRVRILDANAEELSLDETVQRIVLDESPIIGFTAVTNTISIVLKLCKKVKSESDKIIIVGGPHVSFMSVDTLLEQKSIDIIVRNEGEETMKELIPLLINGRDYTKVAGITFRNKSDITTNIDRGLIKNISDISFPARHLLPLDKYKPSVLFNLGFKGTEYATIISARGCPNKCVFCSSTYFWKRLRLRSVDNLIEELKLLVDKYNVKQIDFLDDTISCPISRIIEICKGIIDNNLELKWACYSRVDTFTEEAVSLMKEAGCFAIQFGIESGNQKILNKIKKNITLRQVEESTQLAKKHGLKVMGDFMIGLPGDTSETVEETINFAKSLPLNLAFFSVTTPFPGTELFMDYLNEGILSEHIDWDKMTLHNSTNYGTNELTSDELWSLYKKAITKFHFRPVFWFNTFMWFLKNPYDFKNYFALFYTYIIKMLKRDN